MQLHERYLHFDNIDITEPDIRSCCSLCGQQFSAVPKQHEKVDDALLRIREEYNAHECKVAERGVILPTC